MEFFEVPCPGRGKVSVDGSYQGDNRSEVGGNLDTFQCGRGLHDISMSCLVGRICAEPVKRLNIIHSAEGDD